MPNAPAIAGILREASQILEASGHPPSLDGYQSDDPRRVWMLSAAIWSVISGKSLSYTNPPASFEQNGQKVRTPDQILNERLATCLDTTLLFAAALESAGLNSVIILQHGHSFAGVWLHEKSANSLVVEDVMEVRKALVGQELITFETTLVTSRPSATFESAIERATAETSEESEHNFCCLYRYCPRSHEPHSSSFCT